MLHVAVPTTATQCCNRFNGLIMVIRVKLAHTMHELHRRGEGQPYLQDLTHEEEQVSSSWALQSWRWRAGGREAEPLLDSDDEPEERQHARQPTSYRGEDEEGEVESRAGQGETSTVALSGESTLVEEAFFPRLAAPVAPGLSGLQQRPA